MARENRIRLTLSLAAMPSTSATVNRLASSPSLVCSSSRLTCDVSRDPPACVFGRWASNLANVCCVHLSSYRLVVYFLCVCRRHQHYQTWRRQTTPTLSNMAAADDTNIIKQRWRQTTPTLSNSDGGRRHQHYQTAMAADDTNIIKQRWRQTTPTLSNSDGGRRHQHYQTAMATSIDLITVS